MIRITAITIILAVQGSNSFAADAMACMPKCTYPSEALRTDKAFRSSIEQSLRTAKLPIAKWFYQGVETPFVEIPTDAGTYYASSVCQPHNCGSHRYELLYFPRSKRAVGRYHPDGKDAWLYFGKPSEFEKNAMVQR